MTGEAEEISLLGEFKVDMFITTVKSITKNINKIRITVNVYVLDYDCFPSLSLNVMKVDNRYVQTVYVHVRLAEYMIHEALYKYLQTFSF